MTSYIPTSSFRWSKEGRLQQLMHPTGGGAVWVDVPTEEGAAAPAALPADQPAGDGEKAEDIVMAALRLIGHRPARMHIDRGPKVLSGEVSEQKLAEIVLKSILSRGDPVVNIDADQPAPAASRPDRGAAVDQAIKEFLTGIPASREPASRDVSDEEVDRAMKAAEGWTGRNGYSPRNAMRAALEAFLAARTADGSGGAT